MESSLLSLTSKGQDELSQKVYKLNLKKRSVLLLLKHSKQEATRLSDVIKKGVLPAGEVWAILEDLIDEGFVSIERQDAMQSSTWQPGVTASPRVQQVAQPAASPSTSQSTSAFFSEDIDVIEARFLLNDFCLDVFKTQAPKYSQNLTACKTVPDLVIFVNDLRARIEATYPDKLPWLEKVIFDIKQSVH